MKSRAMGAVLCLAVLLLAVGPLFAQESKLGPGWLSLDGSVGLLDKKVQDGKSSLEKALGISISGFLDTSYTWSSNNPGFGAGGFGGDDDISVRTFDIDHNEIVFNHFNLSLEKPEKDWGVGFKLVADFGRTGELLREATLWDSAGRREPSAELREAFLTTTIPVGKGIGVQGGLFVTLLGTEIIPNPGAYNDHISRSYLFGFSIPFRHLGVLFSYPLHDMVTITAGPVTGWDNPKDNNSNPSFLGGISYTPTKRFSLYSSFVYGGEQKDRVGRKRWAWANVASFAANPDLNFILEYTFGREEEVTASLRDATWQGVAGIISYNWTDRFNTALRGEFFQDRDGSRIGGDIPGTHARVEVNEFTLSGAYKFTSQLLGRLEVRQDWANRKVFQERDTDSDRGQTTFTLQAIYTF